MAHRLHEREYVMQQANSDLYALIEKHGLTNGEVVRLYAEHLASIAKWMIRDERHPDDPSKPGGIQ